MPGFSAQIAIDAAPADIFAFISKTANMPRYLPTLEKAALIGEDRVRLRGAVGGRRYEVEGHLHVDGDARLMAWGSDAPGRYNGELRVFETDDGAELACRIEFEPGLQSMSHAAGRGAAAAGCISATLDDILRAVKQAVESRRAPAAAAIRAESPV